MEENDFCIQDRVRFAQADPEDAPALTELQIHIFDADARRFCGGPPGYDSVEWQIKMMRRGHYYKILSGERIIGGFLVLRLGPSRFELSRIWIDPKFQSRGIGTLALEFLEDNYPARRWTLDTPSWAARSQHFYEKMGYCKIGEVDAGDGLLYLYEKRL
jgi:ribosomal protein S18 acetylase RimI-like enzyme